jgi:hypothetical protein
VELPLKIKEIVVKILNLNYSWGILMAELSPISVKIKWLKESWN